MSGEWSDLARDIEDLSRRAPDARKPRQYEPSVEYKAGEMTDVAISLSEVPVDEVAWKAEIARVTGLTVPDHRKVELAQVRFWGDPASPNVYCRFLLTDREDAPSSVDAVQILRDLRKGKRRKKPEPYAGNSTFCISFNDWQLGKLEAGGTEAFIGRFDRVLTMAVDRIRELRSVGRDIGSLVILGGGDLIEGCGIFANQTFEIDSDRRTQIRNAVTLILAGIDRLAPMFKDVRVLVVSGNHGEHRIGGKRTTRHDNDDAAVFEHAALAVDRDDELSHVSFFIAKDEPAKTLEVNGWILATTHGHVFGRSSGGASAKALAWFKGQAAGRQPAGDADLLITHHYHHYQAQDWGACGWIQTPALDGGSPFFTDTTGMHSKPGVLTWVMNTESRFADMQILEP